MQAQGQLCWCSSAAGVRLLLVPATDSLPGLLPAWLSLVQMPLSAADSSTATITMLACRFWGDVVKWGSNNHAKTPGECCEACQKHVAAGNAKPCNGEVYCQAALLQAHTQSSSPSSRCSSPL